MKYLALFLLTIMRLYSNPLSWEKTDFIWNFNFIQESNVGLSLSPKEYFANWYIPFNPSVYHNIQPGDLVWIQAPHLINFCNYCLPFIQNPFVLIINDSDFAFPSDFKNHLDVEAFVQQDKILHIFAQNCDYIGPSHKVSPLPIGVDFHSVAYKNGMWGETGSPLEQEASLKNLLKELKPTHERKKRAFVDFQHSDTMRNNPRYAGESRTQIFEQLKTTGLIDHGPIMNRSDLWRKKGKYAFSISPHGNGWDCHRTWEDLILGCIVIVKTSPLDPLYEGLPVIIIQDWAEVTEENLDKWLEEYGDAFTNPLYREKLSSPYWLNKLQQKR